MQIDPRLFLKGAHGFGTGVAGVIAEHGDLGGLREAPFFRPSPRPKWGLKLEPASLGEMLNNSAFAEGATIKSVQ